MGRPDSYTFRGSPEDALKMIGNAVPVGIARWLGERAIMGLGGTAERAA